MTEGEEDFVVSADNGIYIARFNRFTKEGESAESSFEFRVSHQMGIEICDYSDDVPHDVTLSYRYIYFAEAPVFSSYEDAFEHACEILESMEGLPVEYGICLLTYDHTFPTFSLEIARDVIEQFWKKSMKTQGLTIHEASI